MTQEDSSSCLPTGLHFYWYECKPGEDEHPQYWAQLCGSLHRLAFVREELEAINEISDIDLALQRLAYHMENYLVRIYELRERAAKLLKAFSGYKGKFEQLKRRKNRQDTVNKLSSIDKNTSGCYLQLLSFLDDDIDLRNENTHQTFLSLGYSTAVDVYEPHDLLIELQRQPKAQEDLKEQLREEIEKTVQRYCEKIDKIIHFTEVLLDRMDFIKNSDLQT